jgi:hypothetical protein
MDSYQANKMSDKQEQLSVYSKIISYLTYVVMPVILGNVVYWSHGVITGKHMTIKVRIAIFGGSLAMASFVHYVCTTWNYQKIEWIAIWFCSIFTEHMLRFLYFELWDIIKDWLRDAAKRVVNKLGK